MDHGRVTPLKTNCSINTNSNETLQTDTGLPNYESRFGVKQAIMGGPRGSEVILAEWIAHPLHDDVTA
jgi:hypothetical protein